MTRGSKSRGSKSRGSGQEGVPLLSDQRNMNRRVSVTSNSKQNVAESLLLNQKTDFDQADSWGMLHESDTDYDLERADTIVHANAFIDHRPSLANNSHLETTPLVKKKANAPSISSAKYSRSSFTPSTKFKKNKRISTSKKNNVLKNDDVVIDVDALLDDVNKNRKINGIRENQNSGDSRNNSSSNRSNEDAYNSRPSSRGSSSNSSLDDVCLVLDDETSQQSKVWPDISVLEEFSKEEIERFRRQAIEDAEAFHYHYDTEDDDVFNNGLGGSEYNSIDNNFDQTGAIKSNRERILFSKPIVTNIDVPELGNKQVNEAELLTSGRLRPKRIAPWHLMQRQAPKGMASNASIGDKDLRANMEDKQMRENFLGGRNIQYPPHIISNNPEHFKFAYFRIDLDSTVHSPTISGLLQPGQTFEDLFVSSVYSNPKRSANISSNTIFISRESIQQPQAINSNAPKRVPSSIKFQSVSPLDTSAAGTIHGNSHAPLHNNGISGSQFPNSNSLYKNVSSISTSDEDVAPFWLDVSNPTEEEMKVISKAFGIHPLTTEDIFLGEVREKVEIFKDYYLICFRSFDIVAERHIRKKKEKINIDSNGNLSSNSDSNKQGHFDFIKKLWNGKNSQAETVKSLKRRASTMAHAVGSGNANDTDPVSVKSNSSYNRRKSIRKKEKEREIFKRKSGDRHKPRAGELEPLNVYIIVFRTGVLTFHFAPTPHPINVRRRARLLKDYLDVTSDWIAYAIIDDITDAFAPMIELIEDEVYDIEDAILKMNHNGSDSDSDSDSDSHSDSGSSSDSSDASEFYHNPSAQHLYRRRRRNSPKNSIGGINIPRSVTSGRFGGISSYSDSHSSIFTRSTSSSSSSSSRSSDISTFNANIIGWKKKGDMLRRIGDCRKRVMSILRLLGAKADVIKGFAKRYNGQWDTASHAEISMYLDDIQDHIITMVSSLNHYEKLSSRSHSNYLAQINIDMTKVNNDMNDVLSKITILGTIVLPMNVVTGLWGMNVIVPGQFEQSLYWFTSILGFILILACVAYIYTKRKFGF